MTFSRNSIESLSLKCIFPFKNRERRKNLSANTGINVFHQDFQKFLRDPEILVEDFKGTKHLFYLVLLWKQLPEVSHTLWTTGHCTYELFLIGVKQHKCERQGKRDKRNSKNHVNHGYMGTEKWVLRSSFHLLKSPGGKFHQYELITLVL